MPKSALAQRLRSRLRRAKHLRLVPTQPGPEPAQLEPAQHEPPADESTSPDTSPDSAHAALAELAAAMENAAAVEQRWKRHAEFKPNRGLLLDADRDNPRRATLYLEADIARRLVRFAHQTGRDRGEIIREALLEYLDEVEPYNT